jgi:hypothetical protein
MLIEWKNANFNFRNLNESQYGAGKEADTEGSGTTIGA